MKRHATISLILFPALVAFAAATTSILSAQTTSQSPTPAPSAKTVETQITSPTPSPAPPPKVISVEGHLELDNIIRVEVDHLSDWAAKNDPTKLVPFLNGRAIRGVHPEEIHPDKNRLHFHLEITPENKEVWTVISPVYGVIALLVVLVTLILFAWLARTTNLIREPGPCPVPGKLRPYNLGRTQMAFWFFLIYASYVTIWLITDALDTITPSLLGLMGISAGTALGEALIDSGKDSANSNQLQSLTAEKQTLEQGIPELQTQIAALNAKSTLTPEDTANRDSLNKQLQDNRKRLGEVSAQVQILTPAASAGVSRGLLRDILSDSSGYSFHRFQIFAWTIVLGVMFVSSVYNNLSMPEFSATLLGLMGISSGTYIGFKFPETK